MDIENMLAQHEMTAAEIGLLAIQLYIGEESLNLSFKCMLLILTSK